jgi:hypothetical protein
MDLADLSRAWHATVGALADASHHLHIAQKRIDELILALSEIATAIKRANMIEDLDPCWSDFVAAVNTIDFAVSSACPDKVALLQSKCALVAAILGERIS